MTGPGSRLLLGALLLGVGCTAAPALALPAREKPGPGAARLAVTETFPPTPYHSIISTGPLTRISIGSDLTCQVRFLGDRLLELYPPDRPLGSCGTLMAVDGKTLYAPNFKAIARGQVRPTDAGATWGLGTYVPFEPVSQSAITGDGTVDRPWTLTTEVRAGDTGLLLRQVDTYIARDAGYRTDVTVTNTGRFARGLVLYRAADCYLQESDFGYGFIGRAGTVACTRTPDNLPPDRVEQWVPLSAGGHFVEDSFEGVWNAVGTKRSFPDTCRCGTNIDNGSGISWYLELPPGRSATRSNILSFSAEGVVGSLRSNDTTPPQIVVGNLPPGCTRADLDLRISIFDANPVSHIRVSLDGRLIHTSKSPFFNLSIPIESVSTGGHRIRVTATDAKGNHGAKSRVFSRCGGAPTLTG